ncbi:hypothetical protein HK104_005218 [Borealophlyctis nickersoniae]|nr:hypothetical protein HK104_005218 [Borealophlyctis nickersoniae]
MYLYYEKLRPRRAFERSRKSLEAALRTVRTRIVKTRQKALKDEACTLRQEIVGLRQDITRKTTAINRYTSLARRWEGTLTQLQDDNVRVMDRSYRDESLIPVQKELPVPTAVEVSAEEDVIDDEAGAAVGLTADDEDIAEALLEDEDDPDLVSSLSPAEENPDTPETAAIRKLVNEVGGMDEVDLTGGGDGDEVGGDVATETKEDGEAVGDGILGGGEEFVLGQDLDFGLGDGYGLGDGFGLGLGQSLLDGSSSGLS